MRLQPVLLPIPTLFATRSAPQVRLQREWARKALQRCAELCNAPTTGWTKNEFEVPQPNEGWYWSISHKRKWAVAVISDQPVGIDIESINPRRQPLHAYLAGDREWEVMGDRSWHSFFRLWTAKEACLKAHGVGIAHLLSCRLTALLDDQHLVLDYEGRSWPIEQFYHDNHIVAVTTEPNSTHWHIEAGVV